MDGYWLAIDTATDIASVAAGRIAVSTGARAESGAHVQGARRHAAEIVRLVDFVLARLEIAPADLTGIVIGDGPGSFTGLRIGWATAKGLAQEAGLELVAIPSLLAAAAGGAVKVGPAPIAACFDALRGQVYGALYRVQPQRVETLVPPAVMTLEEFARVAPERPRLVVGDGATRYAAAAQTWSGAPPVALENLPPAATMLLSLLSLENAGRTVNLLTDEPTYGRPAEAQAKWEAHHGRPLPHSSRPPT